MAQPDAPTAATPKLTKQSEFKLPTPVLALEAAPDGRTLFAACLDGSVMAVATDGGTSEVVGCHTSYASGLALLPGGEVLVSGGYDGRLRWQDLRSKTLIREVQAHEFWSWDLAASPDGAWVASVTGRYEAGGYRYEPAPEREPSVRVYDARTGKLHRSFPHVPPTQAVAFSPDSRQVAAGNLMGEVRVWDVESGQAVSQWKTDDLTSWGVIKSHHFLGGIFAMGFHPDGRDLYVCGMGPMVDPMAGNGVQRWQRFDWRAGKRLDQTHDGESGQGLMETLAFHPSGSHFVMAGRLFQGTWNLALFESATGRNVAAVDAKHRITQARFSADGSRLFLAKARGQERTKDGKWTEAGLIEVHGVELGV
jgi:WD40 repeat protein